MSGTSSSPCGRQYDTAEPSIRAGQSHRRSFAWSVARASWRVGTIYLLVERGNPVAKSQGTFDALRKVNYAGERPQGVTSPLHGKECRFWVFTWLHWKIHCKLKEFAKRRYVRQNNGASRLPVFCLRPLSLNGIMTKS